ncbi:MAG: nitroreductase [Armatimonadetes bacterium]|nr:nitroreductase [Armatimonadota bacterium]
MDVYEAIRTRQSIRRYRPDPVPDEVLNRVLDAMRLAPSAGNKQPWRFIVVRDAATRAQLAEASNRQQWIAHAPVVIAACGWEKRAYSEMGGYWNALPVDVAIAFDHLTLAAAVEGLGTCWIGSFDEAGVRRVLGIPEELTVIALTPLGYHDVPPTPKKRQELTEIVCYERWE